MSLKNSFKYKFNFILIGPNGVKNCFPNHNSERVLLPDGSLKLVLPRKISGNFSGIFLLRTQKLEFFKISFCGSILENLKLSISGSSKFGILWEFLSNPLLSEVFILISINSGQAVFTHWPLSLDTPEKVTLCSRTLFRIIFRIM